MDGQSNIQDASSGKARKQSEQDERLKRRYDTLKHAPERTNCENHWQECAEVMSPRKVNFHGSRVRGEKKMNRVYDPTGIQANDMLAAGLHGSATNPSARWFALRMVGRKVEQPVVDEETGEVVGAEMVDINEVEEVKKYLSDVEDIMWQRIYAPGTNFTTAMHEIYLDLGCFGTAILFCGKQENGGLLFEARSLAECVIAENADGKVDTVMRCTEYTVRQMWQMQNILGWKVSDKIREMYMEEKFDERVKVIHVVQPRADREHGKSNSENKPFMSYYFEHEEMHKLAESGFDEFPYQAARWSKYSTEVYGRSPGMVALPEVKMLQAMQLGKIKLLQKAADPPLWLRNDGMVGQTRTIPGGINYFKGDPSKGVMLQPVSLQGLQFLAEDIQQTQERILRLFYADLMRMRDQIGADKMTATEVTQRTQDQMRLFGPLVGRLESEMLGPLVDRVFGILSREDGLLPPPPELIQNMEFTVEYVSPIAQAQKQTAANGVAQASAMLMQILGPEIAPQIAMKRVDPVKLFDWLWALFNNDPDLLVGEEVLSQKADEEEAQKAIGMAGPIADAMQKGAGAMKGMSEAGATAGGAGLDIQALLERFGQEVEGNPEAQGELGAMGEAMGAGPMEEETGLRDEPI